MTWYTPNKETFLRLGIPLRHAAEREMWFPAAKYDPKKPTSQPPKKAKKKVGQ